MSSVISLMEIVKNRLDKDDIEIISRYKDFYAPIFGEESFSEYVYELVKKRNPNKFIIKSSIHIVVQDKSMDDALFLYPRWKHINGFPEIDAKEDIEFAISLLMARECKHIYLLFPKTESFRKHISIKNPKLDSMGVDYTLKLIPYKMNQKNCQSC